MTRKQKIKLTCPECGRPFRAEIFVSITAQDDPELAEKIYTDPSRSLFQTRCPKCGFEASLLYPVLFNDLEAGMMIQFDPDRQHEKQNLNEFKRKIDRTRADMEKNGPYKPTYRFRFVSGLKEFKEKALIFRDGYDDRLIELVKMILFFKMFEQKPDIVIQELYYTGRDWDKFLFSGVTESGQNFEAGILVETYYVAEDFLENSRLEDKDPLLVDPEFAQKIFDTQSSGRPA